ncbi:FecR family protein [Larkinella arboricola]|uniref:FecR family protein n=1 Tax=Larkinella arboricola TaxID=643671 RepID=A0A327WQP5_LARAB|nr:FecR family protein [Larkinella arboricola]RAJ94299.1 FecR family protein [Larkinella arboricola]
MPKISPHLLDKYLRNECTEQENELVEAWYASLSGQPDYLDSLPKPAQHQLQDETFRHIQHELQADEKPLHSTLPWGWIIGLAASVALVLGLYFSTRYVANENRSLTEAAPAVAQQPRKKPADLIHFVNQKPRLVKHQLPDNSTVWMHSGAAITYPSKFDRDKRLVTFSGEGFFDVKKNPAQPFFIQSGEMRIKVLGTSFNVKAPASHAVFRISVVTGRVQVSAPDQQQNEQQVILKPQQQATFETASRRLTSSPIPVQYKKQIYEPVTVVFENTPLDEVARQLEKRFDIQVRFSNPKIATCLVNADFEQQPLPLIMEMLCTALEATYTLSGNVLTLDGLPCD